MFIDKQSRSRGKNKCIPISDTICMYNETCKCKSNDSW